MACPTSSPNWIRRTLFERFHSLLPGVELHLDAGLEPAAAAGRFQPLSERAPHLFSRLDVVQAEPGVKLHYGFRDAALIGDAGAAEDLSGRVALLRRGEMYDVNSGSPWAYNAPLFGIPFAARLFTVLIELEDGYSVFPDHYRQFLCYADGGATRVTAKGFAGRVKEHRPAWAEGAAGRVRRS